MDKKKYIKKGEIRKPTKKLRMHLDKDADCTNNFCDKHTPGGCYMTMELYYIENKLTGYTAKPRKGVKCGWKKKITKPKQPK